MTTDEATAPTEYKLSEDLAKRIRELASDLSNFASDLQADYDADEDFAESEQGVSVGAWLETVTNMAQDLEDLPEEP